MILNYELLDSGTPGTEVDCTIVDFPYGYGESNKDLLIQNLPSSGLVYDRDRLPEEIVIVGTYLAAAIHSVMTGRRTNKIKRVDT